MVYSLSFNLANLNWPKEQSTIIRYLWKKPHTAIASRIRKHRGPGHGLGVGLFDQINQTFRRLSEWGR